MASVVGSERSQIQKENNQCFLSYVDSRFEILKIDGNKRGLQFKTGSHFSQGGSDRSMHWGSRGTDGSLQNRHMVVTS